jgi:hypothetical protein
MRPSARTFNPSRAKCVCNVRKPRHQIHVARGSEHDLPDLRRGPLRTLTLERERQLQRLRRRARRDHPRLENKRLEPAVAIRADPPIQRGASDPDDRAVRADMLTLTQGADQPAALPL